MTLDFTIFAEGLAFPEGPVALSDGSVLVVEIAAGRLSRCYPDGRTAVVADVGGGPNGAAIGPDGYCYVCNNGGFAWRRDAQGRLFPHGRASDYCGGSIQRVDIATGRVEMLYDRVGARPLSGPNDLVFDASGGFWFTDLGNMAEEFIERGRLCYARADGRSAQEVVSPMLTPNGVALSPDGSRLYVAETVTTRLWEFEVIGPGQLLGGAPATSPGRIAFAARERCAFDSLAVEANGNICIGTLGTGGVTVVSPSGEFVQFRKFPDRSTTNLCFGGPQLRTAFITQSRSGQLLAARWSRTGYAPPFSGAQL